MEFDHLGPYRIGRKLGRGGMGSVYEGIEADTGRRVAVKVLAPALATEEGFRERFKLEIESLKKLRHPGIVRLYGYGEQEQYLFYSMELVEGSNLEDELRAGRRFSWREVTHIAVDLCRALKHAHDHGVIHRDLKPANLLFTPEGRVKLTDFGIARLFGITHLTSGGGVLGTAEYMAPEQAEGKSVTLHADLYSLGCVMYALLAGRPPFRASGLPQMLHLQRYAEPEPVSRFAPEVPEELENIIAKLLEKDPRQRFANAAVLARRLEAMERGLSLLEGKRQFAVEPAEESAAAEDLDPLAETRVAEDGDGSEASRITSKPRLEATDRHRVAPSTARNTLRESRRFTTVEEEQRRVEREIEETRPSIFSAQTAALIISIVALAGVAWYFLQPPSADALYEEIATVAEPGEADNLLPVADEIDAFLERFPEDPRRAQVADWYEEIELERLERKLQRLARRTGREAALLPIERSYLEAISYLPLDVERAAAKLRALVQLYDRSGKETMQVRLAVELARRQLARLEAIREKYVPAERALLSEQLNRADKAAAEQSTEKARRLWQSIIDLHGDKQWAADLVAQARTRLAESEPPASAPSP